MLSSSLLGVLVSCAVNPDSAITGVKYVVVYLIHVSNTTFHIYMGAVSAASRIAGDIPDEGV